MAAPEQPLKIEQFRHETSFVRYLEIAARLDKLSSRAFFVATTSDRVSKTAGKRHRQLASVTGRTRQ